jgi:hypothetical protein
MERLKNFNEFLQAKAKTAVVADYSGPTPTKPPVNGKYPDHKGQVVGGGSPYKPSTKDVGLVIAEPDGKTPLANSKVPGMTPEKAIPHGKKPADRPKAHKPSGKKIFKELFNTTKNMGEAEFVEHMLEEGKKEKLPTQMVHDLHGQPFTPHPHEAIGYICSLMHDPKMVSRLVREAKRHGHMEGLVGELMDHPEFYDETVKKMGDQEEGRKITDKLARTMQDHHTKFRKDAGFNEAYQRHLKLLNEKVSGSLVDGDLDPEEAGIPTHDDEDHKSENPVKKHDGDEDDKGMDPSEDDGRDGAIDGNEADGSNEDELGDSKDDGDNDGITPAHGHMLKSLHGHFGRDTINKYCKDGDC